LKNLIKNILLNENKFLFFKKINNTIELNQEEIVVAIGIIIKPKLLKKYRLKKIFRATEVKEI
jgi:hypothetical protein|tara:strand:- start:52 stop:240 length:189 start_codon:yes stop_codon:yes gene_type:complete